MTTTRKPTRRDTMSAEAAQRARGGCTARVLSSPTPGLAGAFCVLRAGHAGWHSSRTHAVSPLATDRNERGR